MGSAAASSPPTTRRSGTAVSRKSNRSLETCPKRRSTYYLRGPKVADVLPLEAQILVQPTYVTYHRDDDTSPRFRLPENSAIYRTRAGVRVGGVPPDLFPELTAELSLWHQLSYLQYAGRFGLPERPQQTKHLTQRTWMRLGEDICIAAESEVFEPLAAIFRHGRVPE